MTLSIARYEEMRKALEQIVSGLNCRGTVNAHYCPNCDNSLHNVREIAIAARAALQESHTP